MEGYSFGRTLSRAFALVRDGLPSVGVFLLILQVVGTVISYITQNQMASSLQQGMAGGAAAPAALFGSAWYWLSVAGSLVLGVVIYTGSIHGYLAVERRAPVSVADCFTFGLTKFLPGLGLLILWFLGVGLGWVLLLVPGLILITMWSAALPALVGEDCGVTESFGRSRALTKGYRWPIFGTLLIGLLIMYAPLVVVGGLVFGSSATLLSGQALSPMFYLVTLLYGWAAGMFISALMTSIYLDCRLAKEGATSGHITDVFS
jgi:hypothetical protein